MFVYLDATSALTSTSNTLLAITERSDDGQELLRAIASGPLDAPDLIAAGASRSYTNASGPTDEIFVGQIFARR